MQRNLVSNNEGGLLEEEEKERKEGGRKDTPLEKWQGLRGQWTVFSILNFCTPGKQLKNTALTLVKC